jgi:FAD binding domain
LAGSNNAAAKLLTSDEPDLLNRVISGSLQGLPLTGRSVEVPGADFIQVEGDKIRSVQGYFDSRAVPEQLGLQVVVQPKAIGPFSFVGANARTLNREPLVSPCSKPAPMKKYNRLARLVREIVKEMLEMQGFIGWMGMIVGHRMMTVATW